VSFAAIILAGGKSSRMGVPKALLEFEGETFLDRLIGVFSPFCSPVIAVLGHEPERIRQGLRRATGADIRWNADHELGQLTSLQCGLRAVPAAAPGVLFTPVDYPAIRPETIRAMIDVAMQERALLVLPRYMGKRGHPVLCSREIVDQILALPPDGQARSVIRRYQEGAHYVDIDDPGVLDDIDDPDTYRRLLLRTAGSR
jgi:molybdenum cofactor cytidylyltransferase